MRETNKQEQVVVQENRFPPATRASPVLTDYKAVRGDIKIKKKPGICRSQREQVVECMQSYRKVSRIGKGGEESVYLAPGGSLTLLESHACVY
jgi:hypothetical protein